MERERCMSELRVGESAEVIKIGTASGLRRRLQDMGLIKGTIVTCVGRSPLGDPCAYRIRRTIVALRKEDTRWIETKSVEGESDWEK